MRITVNVIFYNLKCVLLAQKQLVYCDVINVCDLLVMPSIHVTFCDIINICECSTITVDSVHASNINIL